MATRKSTAKTKAKARTTVKTKAKVKAKAAAKSKAKAKAKPKAKAASKAAIKAKRPKAKKAKAKTAAKTAKTAKAAKKAPAKKVPVKTRPKAAAKVPEAHLQARGITPYKLKRGEEYMNEPQKEHFKNILRNWRNELMQEVDRTVHHMQDEAANPPDPADRATLEEEFSIELRTRDRERRLIKKIDSTIELIANDDYGWCDSCGVEIGIRRLEARPTANKCIDCKTLDEIKEKQLG